jgi:ABC-type maltose transport system permease subunit
LEEIRFESNKESLKVIMIFSKITYFGIEMSRTDIIGRNMYLTFWFTFNWVARCNRVVKLFYEIGKINHFNAKIL